MLITSEWSKWGVGREVDFSSVVGNIANSNTLKLLYLYESILMVYEITLGCVGQDCDS